MRPPSLTWSTHAFGSSGGVHHPPSGRTGPAGPLGEADRAVGGVAADVVQAPFLAGEVGPAAQVGVEIEAGDGAVGTDELGETPAGSPPGSSREHYVTGMAGEVPHDVFGISSDATAEF
jgi:hypothetical protein